MRLINDYTKFQISYFFLATYYHFRRHDMQKKIIEFYEVHFKLYGSFFRTIKRIFFKIALVTHKQFYDIEIYLLSVTYFDYFSQHLERRFWVGDYFENDIVVLQIGEIK